MAKYDIKQCTIALESKQPQIQLPDDAIILLGKFSTVPSAECQGCKTLGVNIVYLVPTPTNKEAKKEE